MNAEVNFCTKEVLEPVEKAEEKEDLKLEGIVVVWVPDGVAVIVLGGMFGDQRRGRL